MITGEEEDEGEEAEAAEDEEKGCGTRGEGEVGVCSVDIFVSFGLFEIDRLWRKEGKRWIGIGVVGWMDCAVV